MKLHLAITILLGTAFGMPIAAQQSFNQGPAGYPQQQAQPMGYPNAAQQGAYPQGQQGAYPQGQQGAYPQGQQGAYPQGQQGAYPQGQQGAYPQGQQGGMGNGGMQAMAPGSMQVMQQAQAVLQAEMQDFGIPPQNQLHTEMHAPTPTSIPGGQLITSDRLMQLYQQGQQNGLLVFDVLGAGPNYMLPMAQNAVGAAQPGSFDDQTQQQFGQYLGQVTQGNKGRPMVFYCQGTHCWMSYNAALRAIHLGYTQVYWYRGGVEAWQQLQQLASAMPQQGQPQMQAGQPMPASYPSQDNPYRQYQNDGR